MTCVQAVQATDCAQTNVALYNQLCAAGWPESELLRARRGYELGAELFAGRFRPMGKPFVCHLVGVASLLERFGAPRPTVIAGLIHSVYPQGDFGTGRSGPIREHRERVREAVGAAVEELVERYARLKDPDAPGFVERAGAGEALTSAEREVLTIDLVDTLEEHQDYGILYSRKAGSPERRESRIRESVATAELLGHPELAAELEETLRRAYEAERPEVLVTGHRSSYTLAAGRPRRSTLVRALASSTAALRRVRRASAGQRR